MANRERKSYPSNQYHKLMQKTVDDDANKLFCSKQFQMATWRKSTEFRVQKLKIRTGGRKVKRERNTAIPSVRLSPFGRDHQYIRAKVIIKLRFKKNSKINQKK